MKQVLQLFILAFTLLAAPVTEVLAGGPLVIPAPAIAVQSNPQVRTYPNPVVSDLNLEVSLNYVNEYTSVEVKVTNMLGQEVSSAVKFDIDKINQTFKIDLKEIPAGLYMIDINFTGSGSSTQMSRKIRKI